MNFLLHRHLALADLRSEEAALGAMLPDLWRMADRRVRARSGTEASRNAGSRVRRLLDGVAHHLRADDRFHRHPVFVAGERTLLNRFRDARIEAPKIGLFAHIAWELCLDGALLWRADEPAAETARIQGALGSTLERLRGGPLAAAVDHHTDFQIPDAFHHRLEELVLSLVTSDWISGYAHGPGIAARLGGVRRRTRLPPFSGKDLARLGDCLDQALADAGPALERFLADWPRQGHEPEPARQR